MFSGLTNQMSSWMGKKQDGDVSKPSEEERVPDPATDLQEDIPDPESKKETSPTKAGGSGKLEMLGNLGGSVKSQMSSWLGGGIAGLRKGGDTPGEGQQSETPAEVTTPPQQTSPPAKDEEDDDASSATGGADSEGHLSEAEGEGEDKNGQAFGSAISTKAMTGVKTFGNFLYSAANKAGKTVSEASAKIKKTVEENTLLGEFDKAQEAFLKEKAGKGGNGSGLPPWVGRTNEEALKEECLSLSTDRRNFVRAPPEGVEFLFDLDNQYPIAMATLAEDPNLEKMRFELVPKVINEENFWRNYFYRVGLICQAHEVSSMAQEGERSTSLEAEPTGVLRGGGENDVVGRCLEESPHHEFVSDGFTASSEDIEEVREGMRKLGIQTTQHEEEWERELEAELQEYEMVSGDSDKNLDNQIETELDDLK